MRMILALTATLAMTVVHPDPASAQRPKPAVFGVFAGDTMYTVLPPDAIPAIHEPEWVRGKAAGAQMAPDEPVIGVSIGNDAVCWSTWHLDRHEIVNDHAGGQAIAATW